MVLSRKLVFNQVDGIGRHFKTVRSTLTPLEYVINEINHFNLARVILHLVTPEIQDGRHLEGQN